MKIEKEIEVESGNGLKKSWSTPSLSVLTVPLNTLAFPGGPGTDGGPTSIPSTANS